MSEGKDKKEDWKVFKEKATGRELCAYTIRGTFPGEEEATAEHLAHENGLKLDQIEIIIERR